MQNGPKKLKTKDNQTSKKPYVKVGGKNVHDLFGNIPCVVLLSGGLDSAVTAALAKKRGFEIYCMSFDYGQRHKIELKSAKKIAKLLGAKKHLVLNIDMKKIGGSALTGDIKVPKGRKISNMADEIPVTYVPARNTVFLSFAMGWCEVLGANTIFIGANAVDFSGYPDCRPDYIKAFQKMANLATKKWVSGREKLKIETPLMKMTKVDIVKKAAELGIDIKLTHSCYDPAPSGQECGRCDSCLIRNKAIKDSNLA